MNVRKKKAIDILLILLVSICVCLSCTSCTPVSKKETVSEDLNEEDIAKLVVEYLSGVREGKKITTAKAVSKVIENDEEAGIDLMKIHTLVCSYAQERGITLDNSKYADQIVGMPYSIPYIVRFDK